MFVSPSPPSRPGGSLKLLAWALRYTCHLQQPFSSPPGIPALLYSLWNSGAGPIQPCLVSRGRGRVIKTNTETTKLRDAVLHGKEIIMRGGVGKDWENNYNFIFSFFFVFVVSVSQHQNLFFTFVGTMPSLLKKNKVPDVPLGEVYQYNTTLS